VKLAGHRGAGNTAWGQLHALPITEGNRSLGIPYIPRPVVTGGVWKQLKTPELRLRRHEKGCVSYWE
jgi:hypothetical protein